MIKVLSISYFSAEGKKQIKNCTKMQEPKIKRTFFWCFPNSLSELVTDFWASPLHSTTMHFDIFCLVIWPIFVFIMLLRYRLATEQTLQFGSCETKIFEIFSMRFYIKIISSSLQMFTHKLQIYYYFQMLLLHMKMCKRFISGWL